MSAEANEVNSKVEKIVEVVAMSDGRNVEFAGKRRMLKESFFNEDGSIKEVRFDFRNGNSVSFVPSPELLYRFAAHGI